MRRFFHLICLLITVCTLSGMAYADDTTPPSEVDTLIVDPNGDGTALRLDWTGYDESGQDDIASYRIYVETQVFADVSTLSANAVVEAGIFTYTVSNLSEGSTYYIAVVARDTSGNSLSEVTPTSVAPKDVIPPDEVADLHIERTETSITLSWNPPGDVADDISTKRQKATYSILNRIHMKR